MILNDDSDLAALMRASSTITNNKIKSRVNESTIHGRKSLATKHRESTIQLLSYECSIDDDDEQKDKILINHYFERVQKTLSHDDHLKFLNLLSDLHNKTTESSGVLTQNFYSEIENFLIDSGSEKDIIDALVLFLDYRQAMECGKMFEYLYWKRYFSFIRKLEVYSNVDPQCIQRLVRTLKQLKHNEHNLDNNKLKSAISRVLNGQTYLMNELSTLFLDEKPNEYLFQNDEDFDDIIIDSSDDEDKFSDNRYENICIPNHEEELKYGTNECPCVCHHHEGLQSLGKHCTSCSIRFIGGRTYLIQNHKKLHHVEVRYDDEDNEDDVNEAMIIDKDVCEESEKINENKNDDSKWTKDDDRILLELCRSKVINDDQNSIGSEIFDEVSQKLSRKTNDVITRFNHLMDIFSKNQHHDVEDIEIP